MQQKLSSVIFFVILAALTDAGLAQDRPISTFFYDNNGNLTTSVDGLNRPTTKQYDALNRLRRITGPAPAPLQPNPVIQIDLNGRDDVTRLIDPRNLATTYSVNGLGDVSEQSSPDSGVTVRTFKPGGQVLTSRDARGQTTTYTYDALNRVTRARYEDGTASRYTYDQGVNGIGQLTGMVDPGGVNTAWTYDPHGRVLTQTQTVGPRTHALAYSYNSTTGQRMSMTYPSGKIVTYSYGAASKHLEAIYLDGAPIASSIAYHPFGSVKSFTLGNGRAWSNSLDQDGRVVSYTLAGETYSVDWDAANRLTRISSPSAAADQNFGYDNLDRLTGFASAVRSQAFSYDLTGNLLAKSDVINSAQTDYSFSIDPMSNRMTGISSLGIGYSFDPSGNRTGDGRITYAYNARGRLNEVRIIDGATTQVFSYLINGLDLRVRKKGPNTVVPQGMRIFVYDEETRLVGEYDNLGRARAEHLWLEDRPVAVVTYGYSGTSTTPASTAISYVETDHLGTPRLISNVNRRARWSWVSAPYGDTLPSESPSGLNAFTYNLRFTGQYFDKETNHHYNHHRDYESTSGSYVQSDPIGLAGGLNTYSYALNSPAVYDDPSGLQVPLPPRGGVGVGVTPPPALGHGLGPLGGSGSGTDYGSVPRDREDAQRERDRRGSGSCLLYYIKDCANEPIYVGITQQTAYAREYQHRTDPPPDGKIRMYQCDLCPLRLEVQRTFRTRAECLDAEKLEIIALRPFANQEHNPERGTMIQYAKYQEWYSRRCCRPH